MCRDRCDAIIWGRLFYDVNHNGRYDAEDRPLPYQRLIMERRQAALAYSTYTNLSGQFIFPPIPPGGYDLWLGALREKALGAVTAEPMARLQLELHLPTRGRQFIPLVWGW